MRGGSSMFNSKYPALLGFALAAIVAAMLVACNALNPDAGSPATPTPAPADAIAAYCAPGSATGPSCENRDVSHLALFLPLGAGHGHGYDLPAVEQLLEMGLHGAGASPTHIVVWGATQADTVRCAWRPLAMTTAQREESIRPWLGYPADEPLPPAETVAADFNSFVALLAPQYEDAMRANFNHLAYGGVFTDGRDLACYADFAVQYLLGEGPPVITIAYALPTKTRSYDLYQKAHAAGRYGAEPLLTAAEYDAQNLETLNSTRHQLSEVLHNRGSLIFLTPMAAHYSIAIESWQAIAQWDLQRDGDSVYAIRYGAGPVDTDKSVPMDTMLARIAQAARNDAYAGQRIPTIAGLNDYYREIGAYGNIAAPGQPEVLFTPELPPPPQAPE